MTCYNCINETSICVHVYVIRCAHISLQSPLAVQIQLVRAHLSKRGILKVCKAFLSIICHAVVFTQFGYADSKSAPCQALFLVFPFQNCKTKWPPK